MEINIVIIFCKQNVFFYYTITEFRNIINCKKFTCIGKFILNNMRFTFILFN